MKRGLQRYMAKSAEGILWQLFHSRFKQYQSKNDLFFRIQPHFLKQLLTTKGTVSRLVTGDSAFLFFVCRML